MNGPAGKHLFGMVKVGEKGQIVIPAEARRIFGIKPGTSLLVLGDEAQGLALMTGDKALALLNMIHDMEHEKTPE